MPSGNDRNGVDQLGHAITEPLAGVVEWPIVAAIGLGYLALRRWR